MSVSNLQPPPAASYPLPPQHMRGCVGSRITGTAHHTNGNVLSKVCQSNIYKSNHILKALGELAGQKNATLQPFLKGRLLIFGEIPPTPQLPGSPGFCSLVCYDSAPNGQGNLLPASLG